MIKFRLGALTVRVYVVLIVMLGLDILSGGANEAAMLVVALMLHELSHALMARALKIQVVELELMPFGGAMRLENAWGLRPMQMTLVALSGPVMNAVLLIGCVVAIRAGVYWPNLLPPFARANAMLLMFNLLPALPLDGGRVLCGLLGRRLNQARAARIGVIMGRVLAGLILGLAVLGFVELGRVNLSLVACAVFLLVSGGRERIAAVSGSLLSLIDRQNELSDEGALPVRWLAASVDTSLRQTIAQMSPRALHRVAVYDADLKLKGVVEEEQLLGAALDNADVAFGQLLGQ